MQKESDNILETRATDYPPVLKVCEKVEWTKVTFSLKFKVISYAPSNNDTCVCPELVDAKHVLILCKCNVPTIKSRSICYYKNLTLCSLANYIGRTDKYIIKYH